MPKSLRTPEVGKTDMVNLTRAKDAAMAIALAELNAQETLVAAA